MMYSLKKNLCRPFKRKDSNNEIHAYTESKYLYQNIDSTAMAVEHQMRSYIAQICQKC